MTIVYAILCGFCLDLLLADPAWMPHPVVLMGKAICLLERGLRHIFSKTPSGERCAGVMLAVALLLGVFLLSGGILYLCGLLHPALRFTVEIMWSWQAIAVKGLRDESTNVYRCLTQSTLQAARRAVARVVGRDTTALSAQGVAKAAVETVAENFADGVAAPLVFLAIGGAPLGLAYKAVNTMDSMVGYKNERYLHFGRAAAKLDDAANFLPSRLAALLLIAASWLTGGNAHEAYRIWRRDRFCHASPNSAQTEAAMAGALCVQLAGPAYYFGKLYQKPTIGDDTRPVCPQDIVRANKILYAASVLCLLLVCAVRILIVL